MIIDEELGEVEDSLNFRVENDKYVFKFVNDYLANVDKEISYFCILDKKTGKNMKFDGADFDQDDAYSLCNVIGEVYHF